MLKQHKLSHLNYNNKSEFKVIKSKRKKILNCAILLSESWQTSRSRNLLPLHLLLVMQVDLIIVKEFHFYMPTVLTRIQKKFSVYDTRVHHSCCSKYRHFHFKRMQVILTVVTVTLSITTAGLMKD